MNLQKKSPEVLHFNLDFFCYLPDNFNPHSREFQLTSSLHFISKPNSEVYIIIYENVIYTVINFFMTVGNIGDYIPVIFNPCLSIPNEILDSQSRLSNQELLYIFSEIKNNKDIKDKLLHSSNSESNSERLYELLLETGNPTKHLYYHVDAWNIILSFLTYSNSFPVKPVTKTFITNIKDRWIYSGYEENIKINGKVISYLKKVGRKFCCFTGFEGECLAKYREYTSKIESQSQKTIKRLKYNNLWFFEPWDYSGVMGTIKSHIRDKLKLKQGIEKIEHKWGEMSDGRIWIKVEGIHLYSEGGFSSKYIDYSNPTSWPEDMQYSIRDD
ncbi:hypothetical protein [Nodularia sp. UHCC 0506]|uniref:hypothetical protein n=1 Tax=Nodularia sp. UHCC 0506 TaxID=3110243 RepID=UPI002B202B9B|nr:hypothetical protein [Nodularia sp. UHCC 0506]MEA5513099.1 hypothetical protein [Nodularia sp. UHCC 0506]